jgi:hypothetical protein
MPANAGIHDLLCRDKDRSWVPASTGTTEKREFEAAYSIHLRMV